MDIKRKKTRVIYKGNVGIGGDNPVRVQSMTYTDTADVESTVAQIKRLESEACEIVRVAVPNNDAVHALHKIKAQIAIPLVADIHFNYRFALEAIRQGVDCVRINPGNIQDKNKIREIVEMAKDHGISMRIGVNAGSVVRSGEGVCVDMVHAACEHVNFFEKLGFQNMVLSLKTSSVTDTLYCYREMSRLSDYPLHLGITEAGPLRSGTVKTSIGLGFLLAEGIGDTFRVSLSHEPEEEVKVAYEILSTLGLRKKPKADIISCPSCGRCGVDLIDIVSYVEDHLDGISNELTIAVMGCMVNGPGEAADADYGLAWGPLNRALFFKQGKEVDKWEGSVPEIVDRFIAECKKGEKVLT